MGSATSILKISNVRSENILNLTHHGFDLVGPDAKPNDHQYFKFDNDIKNDCYRILQNIKNKNMKKTMIQYHNDIIYVISENYYVYTSSKVYPTSFGWAL